MEPLLVDDAADLILECFVEYMARFEENTDRSPERYRSRWAL